MVEIVERVALVIKPLRNLHCQDYCEQVHQSFGRGGYYVPLDTALLRA